MLILRKPWAEQPQTIVDPSLWARQRQICFLYGGTHQIDAANSILATHNGQSIAASVKGIGFTSAAAAVGASFGASKLVTSNASGTGDFTLMVFTNVAASAQRSIVLGEVETTPVHYLTLNAGAASGADSNRSGGVVWYNFAGPGQYSHIASASTSIVDGQFHVYAVRRSGTTLTLFVDGVAIAASQQNAGTNPQNIRNSGNTMRIAGYTSGSYGLNGAVMPFAAAFNSALSDADMLFSAQNLWAAHFDNSRRLIIPVSAAGGIDASAAGATLTAASSIVAGAATGEANVAGATLIAASTITAGVATGDASAVGVTFSAASTLALAGSAVGDAIADTATITAAATIIGGGASVSGDVSVIGATLNAASTFIAGAVTAIENVSISGITAFAAAILIGGGASTPTPGARTNRRSSLYLGLGLGI